MGGSAVLELSEDVTFYLVCQLLKGCTIGGACLLLYLEPHLIVRWLAIYFLFYLQTLDVIIQRVVDLLTIVFLVLKDILMVDASHHHVELSEQRAQCQARLSIVES